MAVAEKKAKPIPVILTSALIALICSMVLIVGFAFLLQRQVLDIDSVHIVNPIIKAVSAIIASLIGVKRLGSRGWLYGLICGTAYAILSFLIFSILSNNFGFSVGNLVDIAMCGLAGMVGGILHQLVK